MSGTTDAGDKAGGTSTPPPDDPETIASARRLNWKPRDEYTGDPDKWLPAREFLNVAFQRPAVLLENYRKLDSRFDQTERELATTRQQLAEAAGTLTHLTTMVRTAEQRSYDRARRELLAERDKAVETGDKDAFRRVDAELEALKPPPAEGTAEKKPEPTGGGAGGAGGGGTGAATEPSPEIRDFWRRNSWYGYAGNTSPDVDVNLTREADGIFFGLMATRQDLSQAAKLEITEQRVKALFPEKFKAPARTEQSNGGGNGAGGGDNGARNEPAMLTPGGEGGGGSRRQTNNYTFAALPQDSKAAFQKYKKQLDGKGEPLTEVEWAHEYWLQDQGYVDLLVSQGKL